MIRIDRDVSYAGREKNLRISNGDVELLLPTEYGPRILRYARAGGPNVFGELSPADQAVEAPFAQPWHIYGGHRLWYAPEGAPRSYWPDNDPVDVAIEPTPATTKESPCVTLTQSVEGHTRLEKALEVRLDPSGSRVRVTHRITNRSAFDIELAPWALTVMAKGGTAIFPHSDFLAYPKKLAPARPLVLWPFTRMNDPRFTWGDRFLRLRHDRERSDPQKVGFYDEQGWMAYSVGSMLFVKCHTPLSGAHADFGCNVETFTNDAILELETLGPLATVSPGASVEHFEQWMLFEGSPLGAESSEDEMSRALAPLIASAGSRLPL